MMRSMTGYGTARVAFGALQLTVEFRGVNQRHLDVKITAPREYLPWEGELRDAVREVVERGRVEMTIARALAVGRRSESIRLREDVARAYVLAARRLATRLQVEDRLSIADVLRLPDIVDVGLPPPDLRAEHPLLTRAMQAALKAFLADREREGRRLVKDMLARATVIRRRVETVRRRAPLVHAQMLAAARQRIERLAADVTLDPARLTHEVAQLAERADITEELVRLSTHLDALLAALRGRDGGGKRIEFLLQEIHRELNTTGVKSGDVAMTEQVVRAKEEVEKLREQVQNVE
jgi:uncharacterized protein (TIGR00255 family)